MAKLLLLLLKCELAELAGACPSASGIALTVVTLLTVSGRCVMHDRTLHVLNPVVSTLQRTHLGVRQNLEGGARHAAICPSHYSHVPDVL